MWLLSRQVDECFPALQKMMAIFEFCMKNENYKLSLKGIRESISHDDLRNCKTSVKFF